jgi:hypothetical protein
VRFNTILAGGISLLQLRFDRPDHRDRKGVVGPGHFTVPNANTK